MAFLRPPTDLYDGFPFSALRVIAVTDGLDPEGLIGRPSPVVVIGSFRSLSPETPPPPKQCPWRLFFPSTLDQVFPLTQVTPSLNGPPA